jgi:hypothetical protein
MNSVVIELELKGATAKYHTAPEAHHPSAATYRQFPARGRR